MIRPLPQNFLKRETFPVVSESGAEKPTVQNKKKPKKSSKVKNKKNQKKSSKAKRSHKNWDIDQERPPLSKPEAEKISLTKTDLPSPLTHLDDAEVLVIPEKVKEELQGDEKVLKSVISSPVEEQYKEEGRRETLLTIVSEKPKEKEKEEIVDSVSAFHQYTALRPRGMRILHAHQSAVPLEPCATIELKGKLGKIHQNIFDSQKFQNVTFKKFKTLWKHICGNNSVIESNGSSHKKLIGPYGEVFGTYAHSDSMTYGLRTIKYIRDALIQIGYGD